MSLFETLSLKIGYLETTHQLTNQMKIDNLISQLICCMTCTPSTFCWQFLRNWEILSTIYKTTGALPSVPLKVRWWVTIYGTGIRGTTSFLYLMNMRAFAGYIWGICQKQRNKKAKTLNVFKQNYLIFLYVHKRPWPAPLALLKYKEHWGCCFESVETVC